jgi:hypothetical protein
MPKFSVRVPHALERGEVIHRLEQFEQILRAKFKDSVSELEQKWEGEDLAFRFKSFGMAITGKMKIGDNDVAVDGDLPFSAMMFKGKIESAIREQLERLMTIGIIKKDKEKE